MLSVADVPSYAIMMLNAAAHIVVWLSVIAVIAAILVGSRTTDRLVEAMWQDDQHSNDRNSHNE